VINQFASAAAAFSYRSMQARWSESEIAVDTDGSAMTEAEKLEQEIQSLLEQHRLETDPDKKRILFERRYLLRKNWLRMTKPKDPTPK